MPPSRLVDWLNRRPMHFWFALVAGCSIMTLLYYHHGVVVQERHRQRETFNRRSAAQHHTVPSPLPECPQLIIGKNASMTATGPKVLLSTGAYNNVVDGVSKSLNRLVSDLLARNFQVVIIGPTAETPAMEHFGLLYPAPSVAVPFRPEYRLALGLDRCTRDFFEAFNPDLVHIATPDYLGQQVQTWAVEQKRPIVCSYHTRFNSYLPYYLGSGMLDPVDSAVWAWMRFFYNRCHHVYPPTPSVSDELRSHRITSELRIWPRGIDLGLFNVQRRDADLRRAWGADDDTVVLLTVCRLVWEKNLQEIIDTIKILLKQGESFKAVVVGEGPARASMQAQLPEAIFTGFRGGTNLSMAFASADLFFFPSLTETWGAVTLEAMASGLPVIVADAPGSKELVQNGETGFLVKPGRPQRWANAITRLLHDDELRKGLGARALSKVAKTQGFTWERATNMIVGHYSDLLNANVRYKELFEVPSAYYGHDKLPEEAAAILTHGGQASEQGKSVLEHYDHKGKGDEQTTVR
eukprot:TRINITY_DN24273_c0_g1_i1.p1 TRINITY_DN24273_c0_g1~~TRINITY_DN24273_c0_g1_i1.p1  ORF type:complete len:539 (+),score=97.84 TRINITY_DN24273_c0_g1_i1:52-1617(+)